MKLCGNLLGGASRAALATSIVAAGLASAPALAQETPRPVAEGADSAFSSRILTAGLEYPWDMEWGPDGQIWVTERAGKRVTRIDPETGATQTLLTIDEVFVGPQHEGLLGMALHPEFGEDSGNDHVYLNYTYNVGDSDDLENRRAKIVRYTYNANGQQLEEPMELIADMPARNDHNGGDLVIGPDMKLYYSKGEGGANFGPNLRAPNYAQRLPTAEEVENGDWSSYWGKILRMNLDGSIPENNPELDGATSHIYAYGFRNPQGLTFGPDGTLYASDHGPSTDDEVDIVVAGGNYGWPRVAGYQDDQAYEYINWSEAPEDVDRAENLPESTPRFEESEFEAEDFEPPLATFWTVEDDYDFSAGCGWICNPTIAPSSIEYYGAGDSGIAAWDNSLLIPALKHGALYVLPLSADGQETGGEVSRYFNTQNRYRDVLIGQDGKSIFIATDTGGTAAQIYGETGFTNVLHNPGAIMIHTYQGEGAGMGQSGSASGEADSADESAPDSGGDAAASVDESAEADASASAADDGADAGETASLDLAGQIEAGQTVFSQNCAACHGAAGRGGQGPALAGNENVADAGHVVDIVVNGFGYMPPFGSQLDDGQIANVATFVRNSWGNEFGAVSPDEVAAQRN